MSDLVVFDFETLATTEDAVVLSLGVAVFKEEWVEDLLGNFTNATCQKIFDKMIKDGLYMKFNVAEQIKTYHRTVSKSTISWWATQGAAANIVMKPSAEDISISEIEPRLKEWRGDRKKGTFWSRGIIDSRWLESIVNQSLGNTEDNPFSREIPWPNVRDVRTAIDELLQLDGKGKLPKELRYLVAFPNFIAHNALHDSALDALNVVIARVLCFTDVNEIKEEDVPF